MKVNYNFIHERKIFWLDKVFEKNQKKIHKKLEINLC
jgi:hypothetical protein